jgi:hypothetical protein
MKTILTTLTSLWLASPLAFSAPALEVWSGQGNAYDEERNLVGTFKIRIDNTEISEQESESRVVILTDDGDSSEWTCRIIKVENRWQKNCDNGFSGGGYYLDSGLITEYSTKGDEAFATTVVLDSEDQMRVLVTHLDFGNAKAFYTQTLVKSGKQ